MAWTEHLHADAEALAEAVAQELDRHCQRAIEARGRAVIVLAGGRTPLPVYRRWASGDLPWPRVHVIATDERCVPHEHPACNTRALREALVAADPIQIYPLTTPDGEPAASEAQAREMLGHNDEEFDAVLLGMGHDGHVASLFPGAAALPAALADDAADVCRVDPEPLPADAPFARISLSAQRLRRTDALLLVIQGEAKLEVLRRAQAGADPLSLPVAALLHAAVPVVDIHWSP